MSNNYDLPFEKGAWVVDRANPGKNGIFTGEVTKRGPHLVVELEYGPKDRVWRPVRFLEPAAHDEDSLSLLERIERRRFDNIAALRRLLTFEKLRGTLHEIIYSMEAAQIDFYPYQFKPVLKFINSPTDRMVIADEVGLGKTIEAALIWLELQARKQAKRLIVVCPTQILANKWCDELRDKFIIDAKVSRFDEVKSELEQLKKKGPHHSFALVVTYSGLRPSKDDIAELRKRNSTIEPSKKQAFCKELLEWGWDFEAFDLAIFDEAHHMRNAGTSNHFLGTVISGCSAAVLCVSATPVNNTNNDLHSILKLIDEDFFASQVTFQELLESNSPTVQLMNGLARIPVNMEMIERGIRGMALSRFIKTSPLFERLIELLEVADFNKPADVAECQSLAEKLNLLGAYVTRTRRSQVKEHRPVREPVVLEVTFSETEMKLYDAIVQIVRNRCEQLDKVFHVFQVIGLQMRAASSLPVLAQELKDGKLGEPHDLLMESFGDFEEFYGVQQESLLDDDTIEELLSYDYEGNDHKYYCLEDYVHKKLNGEKVVIFSFYRGTLHYLYRRLTAAGITVDLIHGDVHHEERIDIVDRFNQKSGPQVLLTSEVGSEGIDMHENCRCLVNYDMPWNPMRVEQRIGRIDRVGQKAAKLSVVHFKVKGTIEERVYDRLHERLQMFANSLGDLETVIGKEVQELTIELLSKELTPAEEEALIKNREQVIQNQLKNIQMLEQSGDSLVALSDYVQKKIDEGRGRGRYIQPRELERYVVDFFRDNWSGTEVLSGTPKPGCLTIRLSLDARSSLDNFIREDTSLNARTVRHRDIGLTFSKDVHKSLTKGERNQVHFANHLSPLVRWITQCYQHDRKQFYDLSVMGLESTEFKEGTWVYRVERWYMKGLRDEERLVYSLVHMESRQAADMDTSEKIFQSALTGAQDWDYPEIDSSTASMCLDMASENLSEWFDRALQAFEAENQHDCHVRKERAANVIDRRINQLKRSLQTLRERGRNERIIRLTQTNLDRNIENKQRKLAEFEAKAEVDMEKSEVAAGFIKVMR